MLLPIISALLVMGLALPGGATLETTAVDEVRGGTQTVDCFQLPAEDRLDCLKLMSGYFENLEITRRTQAQEEGQTERARVEQETRRFEQEQETERARVAQEQETARARVAQEQETARTKETADAHRKKWFHIAGAVIVPVVGVTCVIATGGICAAVAGVGSLALGGSVAKDVKESLTDNSKPSLPGENPTNGTTAKPPKS